MGVVKKAACHLARGLGGDSVARGSRAAPQTERGGPPGVKRKAKTARIEAACGGGLRTMGILRASPKSDRGDGQISHRFLINAL